MLRVVEVLRGYLAARKFKSKEASVGAGSSEQAVRQALGEASSIVVYATDEDNPEAIVWRYAHALGPRTDFQIAMVEGKWSHAWTAHYPAGQYPTDAAQTLPPE